MTPREIVHSAITFQSPPRLPFNLPDSWGSDFASTCADPHPDHRPYGDFTEERDEWGCLWRNIGLCKLGEVVESPLEHWADLGKLNVPDIREERRWEGVKRAREEAGDRFLVATATSLFERIHFIRGLQNAWMDIHTGPDELCRLIDILVDINLYAIERYAAYDVDAIISMDDWGLQDRLMIDPEKWRALWKPRYSRVWGAAREAGLHTILHSCGYIVDVLDDMIDAGLEVIQMDQQENMGLEQLGERFGGRIAFYSPVDIQNTMARGNPDEIRAYCRDMVRRLGRPRGGFIPKWYPDPAGAGHTDEAIEAMCDEFVRLAKDPSTWGG
ncbi:MAG: uroporphyrinogen decarboxylase family protein [Kiritimatiellia bacterium]